MDNTEEMVISLVTSVDEKSLRENLKKINEDIKNEFANLGELEAKYAPLKKGTKVAKNLESKINESKTKISDKVDQRETYQQAIAYIEREKVDMAKERIELEKKAEARKRDAEDRRAADRAEKHRAKVRLKFSTKSLGLIGRVVRKFENVMIARIARGLLNAIINSARTGVQDLYKWSQNHNGVFAKAMDSIKEDFRYIADIVGSIVGPFIEVLAPIIRNIADAFAEAAERANQFFAALLGRNGYYKAIRMAQQYGSLQNQLLGFDELNVLKGENGSGGGNFEWLDLPKDKLEGLGKLAASGGYIQMGIGAILLFSGHFLVGAGLLASGFANVIAAQGSDDVESKLQKTLKRISKVAAGSQLALGAILIAAGRVPLGIALLAAGVAGTVSAVAVNWNSIVESMQSPFNAILSFLVGGVSLALGAVLLGAPGAWGIGLALIMAGAAGLVTPVVANWNNIINWIKEGFNKIKTNVTNFLSSLGDQLTQHAILTKNNLWEAVTTLVDNAKAKAQALWDAIKAGFENLKNAVISKAREMFTPITDTIATIKGWLETIFNKRYKLDVEVPSYWTDSYIAYHDQYSPDHLASGGTPRMGSLFYAGEAGPELVTSFNGQSTVYNETQLTGSLADANQNVVSAIYDAAANLIAAVTSKDLTIDVNDMRNAFNTQSLRYGL